MSTKSVTATVTAQNTATDWLRVVPRVHGVTVGLADVSVYVASAFSGTITLQEREIGGSARDTGKTYTGTDTDIYECAVPKDIRLICKTGAFTSGSAALELITPWQQGQS